MDDHKALGNTCYRAENFEGAINHFSQSLQFAPNDPLVLGNRAAAFEKIGDYARALQDATDALKADASYLKGYFRRGTALLALERYAEAEASATDGLKRQPNNTQLKALLAKSQELAAVDSGGETTGVDSGPEPTPEAKAEAAKMAGNEQYNAGRYSDAIRLYSCAVRLLPTNATYLTNRAAAYLMVQSSNEALADCTLALSLDPNLAKAHVRAAKALAQMGRVSAARRQLEGAAMQGTADSSLLTELASLTELDSMLRNAKEVLRQEGGAAAREALRLFTILAERCQTSESIACLQMEALLRARPRQGPAQVVAESARWLKISSVNPDLLCVRGKGLYQTGQLESALKHFTEALRQDPDHAGSCHMRKKLKQLDAAKKTANAAFSSGRFKEAIDLYGEALDVDPLNEDVNTTLFSNRATAHFKLGDLIASIEDCNSALSMQPRHLKALLRRASCKMEQGDWSGAIEDYTVAAGIEPDDQGIVDQLRTAKIELKKSQRKDIYQILGATSKATDQEIKKAYRRMALQLHPDRHQGACDDERAAMEVKFKELGEAFEILSDPQKKQQWDQGKTIDEINGKCAGGRAGGLDPRDIFRMYSGMAGGRNGF